MPSTKMIVFIAGLIGAGLVILALVVGIVLIIQQQPKTPKQTDPQQQLQQQQQQQQQQKQQRQQPGHINISPYDTMVHGTHTGALLELLPIADISKPHAGAWNAPKVDWLGGSIVANFQGTTALKVHHDKGAGSTATNPKAVGGVGVHGVPKGLPKNSGGIVFAYDVWYPAGWQWAKGGKMGGSSVGVGKSSGGHHTATGASHRVMWQIDGGAISYIYVPTGSVQPNPLLQGTKDYGFGVFKPEFARALKIGVWNHIEIGTKLNTFTNGKPNADGWASLTVNGVTHAINNVVWRTNPAYNLNDVFISDFFGGPDNSPVDQSSYYANTAVYEWKD